MAGAAGNYDTNYEEKNLWTFQRNNKFPGGRETTTVLTVGTEGQWSLTDGATLHDVTHLPCRSARQDYVTTFGGLYTGLCL